MGTQFAILNTYLEFVCMISLCLVATGALVFITAVFISFANDWWKKLWKDGNE